MTDPGAHGRIGRPATPAAQVIECAYAGVLFELLVHGELAFALPDDYADYVAEPHAHPVAARVTCAVRASSEARPERAALNQVAWTSRDRGLHLRNAYASAELDQLSASHWVASARVAPEPLGFAALLRFVAAAVLERAGGLSLHAAALCIDGRAVLLLGPSGAGKSTACLLARDARCLAYDQTAVYPVRGKYYAWALPLGTAVQLPRTPVPALPVPACLRVTRGTPEPRAWPASEMEALFELRAATSTGDRSQGAEERRLESVVRMGERLPVGYLSTVLGRPSDPAIRAFVGRRAEVAA